MWYKRVARTVNTASKRDARRESFVLRTIATGAKISSIITNAITRLASKLPTGTLAAKPAETLAKLKILLMPDTKYIKVIRIAGILGCIL
jgi:hypothetical protein